MLGVGAKHVSTGRKEEVVRPVREEAERQRRQALSSAQGIDRQHLAHAEALAEIHVTGLDLRYLEAIRETHRRSKRGATRERYARSKAAVDHDPRGAAAVREQRQPHRIPGGEQPRLV